MSIYVLLKAVSRSPHDPLKVVSSLGRSSEQFIQGRLSNGYLPLKESGSDCTLQVRGSRLSFIMAIGSLMGALTVTTLVPNVPVNNVARIPSLFTKFPPFLSQTSTVPGGQQ
jgi:hypothetical protein